ncbi:MAG: hypothetical protein AB7Q97_25420 [Gammaproteobacteria bacterium]
MIRALGHRMIRRLEHRFDYDAAYMHEILDASTPAFLKFALAQSMFGHREALPAEAAFAARFVALRAHDCGSCLQLAVDMALAAGVTVGAVRAILARDFGAMSQDAALAVQFADAVLANAPTEDLRRLASRRWGARGLVSMAYAIVTPQVYPLLKRALGHAQACERLVVDGEPVAGFRAVV